MNKYIKFVIAALMIAAGIYLMMNRNIGWGIVVVILSAIPILLFFKNEYILLAFWFMRKQNMLDVVVDGLEARTGELRKVAEDTGISYDTVLRIKNRESDPAFGRVFALHEYLFARPARKAKAQAESAGNMKQITS